MTKDEALKMAIEALVLNDDCAMKIDKDGNGYFVNEKAINACKEALATNKESLSVEKKQFDFDAQFDAGVLAND